MPNLPSVLARSKKGKQTSKQSMYESVTVKQANHKNLALDAHLRIFHKTLQLEKQRSRHEMDKVRKKVCLEIPSIHHVAPVSCHALSALHRERRRKTSDVCMHVAQCYMMRQDRNKNHYNNLQKHGVLPANVRPVTTPDHLRFLLHAFPEHMSVAGDWTLNYSAKADLYEYGRAGHDMKCMSTRSKPVGVQMGVYPPQKPINLRSWMPTGDLLTSRSSCSCLGCTGGCRSPNNAPNAGRQKLPKIPKIQVTYGHSKHTAIVPRNSNDPGNFSVNVPDPRRVKTDGGDTHLLLRVNENKNLDSGSRPLSSRKKKSRDKKLPTHLPPIAK